MGLRNLSLSRRLLLGFGSLAIIIVLISVLNERLFSRFQEQLRVIVELQLPGLSARAELAQKSSQITEAALALVSVQDENEMAPLEERLQGFLSDIDRVIGEKSRWLQEGSERAQLSKVVSQLIQNVHALDQNVRQRFWFNDQNHEQIARLRWAHADFLDEVEPLISEAQFRIDRYTQGKQANLSNQAITLEELSARHQTLTTLLSTKAAGSLLVEMIARAPELGSEAQFREIQVLTKHTYDEIQMLVKDIDHLSGALSLRQSVDRIMAFSSDENNLFDLNLDLHKNQSSGQSMLSENLLLLGELQSSVSLEVQRGYQQIEFSTEGLLSNIKLNQRWSLLVQLVALLITFITVWRYIGKHLLRRLLRLHDSMNLIADGDLSTEVETRGSDEIADMAQSLAQFRDTLNQTQEELVRAGKLSALGQLSAGIAHELNQPLSGIQYYAHNTGLFIEQQQYETAQENLKKIQSLVERAAGMVNQFKNLARQPALSLEMITVNEVLSEVVEREKEAIEQRDVHLSYSPEGICCAIANKIGLEHVLANLIHNALDSMDERKDKALSIRTECNHKTVLIEIADTGCGIKDQDMEHVFDPFFTTKELGQGTGLGLTIAYNLVKDFGGQLSVKENEQGGSTFTVRLKSDPNSE